MNIQFVILIILQILFSFILASQAKKDGYSFCLFFLFGLLLSPVIGFIVLLMIGNKNEKIKRKKIFSGVLKICPYCYNGIEKEILVCSFCGRDISSEIPNPHIVNISKINVREKPELKSEFIFKLSYNEIVSIINVGEEIYKNNYWIKIRNKDGKSGWCFSEDFLKIN